MTTLLASAQSYVEIVEKASNTEISGTARIQAMGGAQTSLGADISSGFSNPAGIGFYNNKSFAVTAGLNFVNAKSDFYNNRNSESDFRFNTPALGIIFQNDGKDNSIIKSKGFGLTITNTSYFDNSIRYNASNPSQDFSSDFFDYIYSLYDANNFNPDFPSNLPEQAYNAFLVEEDALGLYYIEGDDYPPLPNAIDYSKDIEGGNSALNVAYGININDRVYLGAGLNLHFYDYTVETFYSEFRNNAALERMNYLQYVDVSAAGVSGTFGIIARPLNQLTVGLSYQTRTSYRATDYAEVVVEGIFNNYEYETTDGSIFLNNESSLVRYESEYSFTTPGKLRLGATYLFGKRGLVSFDAEHVNYSGMKLRNGTGIDFSGDNQFIDDNYDNVWNYRVGAEFRLTKLFYLRGGYATYACPKNLNGDKFIYSGGVGFRTKNGLFFDLTYLYKTESDIQDSPFTIAEPYSSDIQAFAPSANIKQQASSVLFTFGKSF
ncbi:hypothetical protein HH304_10480 [Flammeovirgaceae bacterium KN852]|uniref:Outer membrane protein transport protein (OMPP1/FadL/TodX) n=2 Tax=Marinigracilibium pacificum TaxID=2729599 RepID=A0A848IYW1_9BACT|nr:hypothetical protein [Marinigracilibium pacificum]